MIDGLAAQSPDVLRRGIGGSQRVLDESGNAHVNSFAQSDHCRAAVILPGGTFVPMRGHDMTRGRRQAYLRSSSAVDTSVTMWST